jgi:hypothetical protein
MQQLIDDEWLDSTIVSILNNRDIDEFSQYSELFTTQRQHVQSLIDGLQKYQSIKSFNLSIFTAGDVNIIDINVNVNKDNHGKLGFFLNGTGLKKYCSRLLHFIVGKRGSETHYPQNGSNFSKWYPFAGKCIPVMIDMATKFRVLEFHLREQRKQKVHVETMNILGVNIELQIPSMYNVPKLMRELTNMRNPKKVGNGKYFYGVNGIRSSKLNAMLEYANTFESLNAKLFHRCIVNFDLRQFVESSTLFAISVWKNHARILIKCDDTIFVIDPWMHYLHRDIESELATVNHDLNIKFVKRSVKDQSTEGSCVLCSIARLAFIARGVENVVEKEYLLQNVNTQLDDFYAYFACFLYRVSF